MYRIAILICFGLMLGVQASAQDVRSYVADHIRFLLWRPTLCGAGDELWLQMHASGSPTPHNSYQRLRRNCISATSCFQCFGGTAPRISQVASALAFISRSTSA